MYIPYVLHRSLHMLCVITHCSGPLLHQAAARWCKRMRNDCLINIFLFCLVISLFTAHSFRGMGPKTIFSPPPLWPPVLSLLNLCNVWNLLLWSSAYWKQKPFPPVIKAQEPFLVSQIILMSEEMSPGVRQLSCTECPCTYMDRECPELPHFSSPLTKCHSILHFWVKIMLSTKNLL